jgi:hypothetical protein
VTADKRPPQFEESFILKRTSLIAMVAVLCAAWAPAVAVAQLAKERAPRANQAETPRWEIFAGYGYTSLNQVDQSRYGLQGVEFSATRLLGRYFGVVADGAFYSSSVGSGNPGKPSVDAVMAGPVLEGQLFERLSVHVRGLMGGEHTGGESMKPDVSFAGGIGAGMDYKINKRIWVRLAGDNIYSSFVSDPLNKGYSPHMHHSPRATIGLVYKF